MAPCALVGILHGATLMALVERCLLRCVLSTLQEEKIAGGKAKDRYMV